MKRNENPFDGSGLASTLARLAYSLLMTCEKVSYTDVMTEYYKQFNPNASLPCSVSKMRDYDDKILKPGYNELRKVFPKIIDLIKEQCGDENCIEVIGPSRNRSYRYVGENKDPLKDYKTAKAIKDLSRYAQFCIDSAGFLPTSWLEKFLDNTLDLLNIKIKKSKGTLSIVSSADRKLTNMELLPDLYIAIRDKKVLSIEYQPAGSDVRTFEFHPHLLKEYNGRWFLFGYAKGQTNEKYNLALDRIKTFIVVNKPETRYVEADMASYAEFFKDKIGVSKDIDNMPAEDIVFRARNYRMFNLMATKPLHESQTTIKQYGEYDGEKYGEFRIHVEVNNEFIGRILQMGAGLEVISPERVRNIFKIRSKNIYDLYKDDK